jgi:anti-sigma factor RsiW
MTKPATEDHDLQWSNPLLDWLDGDLDAAEAAAFVAHSAGCAICQQQLQDLARLDESMRAALPPIALDAAFDRRIFSQIEAIDESQRAAARRRAEEELQENLQSLSRGWRRTLGLVIPGVIAGIALAFALAGWFDDTGVTQSLVTESAIKLGSGMSSMVHMVLTATIGAGIGLVVARWLAAAAD